MMRTSQVTEALETIPLREQDALKAKAWEILEATIRLCQEAQRAPTYAAMLVLGDLEEFEDWLDEQGYDDRPIPDAATIVASYRQWQRDQEDQAVLDERCIAAIQAWAKAHSPPPEGAPPEAFIDGFAGQMGTFTYSRSLEWRERLEELRHPEDGEPLDDYERGVLAALEQAERVYQQVRGAADREQR
jgi:hypothetical protein